MVAMTVVRKKPEVELKRRLTVLSFGAGQDSTAILYLLAHEEEFRRAYAPGDLLVVFSDTGNEHPMTYLHVISVQAFCQRNGIDFVHIKPDMGFHSENWRSLTGHFDRYDNVMSSCYAKKVCTDGLKIQPIYRFLNWWVSGRYGLPESGGRYRGKRALVEFARDNGKIVMLIGIAKGEESRLTPDSEIPTVWQRLSVRRRYPLVTLGWDRRACQDYIRSLGRPVPPPSNCMMCPFMDRRELLLLYRQHPEVFAEWCDYERRKLRKFAHLGDKNYCVLHKKKTLREVVRDAEVQYGHLTLQELEAHRFSHGHCTMSKY